MNESKIFIIDNSTLNKTGDESTFTIERDLEEKITGGMPFS
jgi:hypothetical protein